MMIERLSLIAIVVMLILGLAPQDGFGQQDPQYTHYMYNTMSINPAYAGQRETLSILGLNRTQWVGIDGAPQTQSFSVHSPLRNRRIGLGLNFISDGLGPARENFLDANFSYTIPIGYNNTKLSFGVKAGWHNISTDWTKGVYQNQDAVFNQDINLNSIIFGSGLYLSNRKWYVGLSVPNLFTTEHYDDFQESLATERLHYFLTGGYVFDLSANLLFKPAFLVKGTQGAPLIADVSANFLIHDLLTFGVAWRWDDSIAGMVGFSISEGIFIGYGYDYTTSGLNNYNNGTHEMILRFEMKREDRRYKPRGF